MNKPELLIPAGNCEKLAFAIAYGADAVYIGGQEFSLRAASNNFDMPEMKKGIGMAHDRGVRVYVTVNAIAHNEDFEKLPDYLSEVASLKPDAFIVADPGVLSVARKAAPAIPIHLSTQANTVNKFAAKFWEDMGVKRIVLGRELSLKEIGEIRQAVSCELEVFVHGAMCISYSGRCLLSNFMTGRDGNRGLCAQACRWKYSLVEETRDGQYFDITEDSRGTYIMNSKDLCMIGHIRDLADTGVDSLKVEGRMKSVNYVASVAKAYRTVLDALRPEGVRADIVERALEELDKVSHRPYFTGFYYGKPTEAGQVYGSARYVRTHEFVGDVLTYDPAAKIATVYIRNRLQIGEEVEILNPVGNNFRQVIRGMTDNREGLEGQLLPAAHANFVVKMPVDRDVFPMSILRRPEKEGT